MRRQLIQRIQRMLGMISVLAVLGMILTLGRATDYRIFRFDRFLYTALITVTGEPVVIIRGHGGNDSGAVCTDETGKVLVTEAEINEQIAELVARRLARNWISVVILDEYDIRLDGLQASALLSLHADSCIEKSGYKAAHRLTSPMLAEESRLVACIDQHYAALTGLAYAPDTVTPDMTEYHAFQRIDSHTPGVILEMGFLGGDQALLVQEADRVARGITESLLCFLAHDIEEPS